MINKKSVTMQWFISYLLLLMIPVIISGVIFVVLEKDIKSEIYEMNNMILSPIKDDADNHLYTLKRVYTELIMDTTFKKTVNSFKTGYNQGFVQASKLRQDARVFVTSNEAINCIYINFYSSGVALYTQGGVHDTKNVDEIVFGDENARELRDFIQKNPRGGFCSLNIMDREVPRKTICYVGTFSESNDAKRQGVVVICANMDYIESRTRAMLGTSGREFVMLDNENQTVFATNDDLKVDPSKREKTVYEDRKNVLSFVELEMTDWCGVAITPKEIFWARLRVTRALCMASIVLSIILGIICTRYILKRNYEPMRSVVNLLADKRKKAVKDENEYSFLIETLSDMLKEESLANKLMDKQSDTLRRNFLIGLLYGDYDIKMPDEIINGVNFLSDSFIVIIFNIVNFKELFSEDKQLGENQRKESAQFIITNIMTELIGKYHDCYMVDVGKELVGIVSLSPQRREPERDVLEALNVGCSVIEDNFNLMVNVIVGRIYEGIDKISEGYKEAYEILEYVRLTGLSGIVQCQELFVDNYYYYYPPELDIQLVNAIKSGSKTTASEILTEIFKKNFEEKKFFAVKVKYLILEIASTLLKVTEDENERKNIADICYMQEDMAQAKEKLFVTVEKLCEKNLEQIQESGSGIEMEVCAYIEEHYQEQTLTIQELGDKFGLAPYYLSRNFKSKMGTGIAEYLRKIRVEKAKEIMTENAFIRFEELTETVGLNGTRALTRAFKQELGILPGEYRKMISKGK